MHLVHSAQCAAWLWHLHVALSCASLSKFVGRVPSNCVLDWFLIVREYCNSHFLCKQSWLGHTDCCMLCKHVQGPWFNHWTGLQLVKPCVCGNFYTEACLCRLSVVLLGQWTVLSLLPNGWGWSTARLVIFDLVMTPQRNMLLHEQEGFLLHDSTSSLKSNSGNISQDWKSDGMRKNTCAITHS